MKEFAGIFIALGLFILFIFAVAFFALGFDRVASPYQEQTRKITYDQSRTYQQGTQLDISRLCQKYDEAPLGGKKAIAQLIRDTNATYTGQLTQSNQDCLNKIGN